MVKLLVLTLYAGEDTLPACRDSAATQDYPAITHEIIENLPNIEAHKTLYETVMNRAKDYDLFLKLDADMVLTRDTAISEMIAFWTMQGRPDHISFAVHDFMPDCLSVGIHLFSKNCRWKLADADPLFIDSNPAHGGPRLTIWDAPAPFVLHGGNPSAFSAFHFGIHRALKAFQWGRATARPQGLQAFRILMRTARHYRKTGDARLRLALIGAEIIRTKCIRLSTGDKNHIAIESWFNRINAMDEAEQNRMAGFWMRPVRAWIVWWILAGCRVLAGKIVR